MEFPNLSWAMSYRRNTNHETAAAAGTSESAFSRKLNGRLGFSPQERRKIAQFLSYSEDWLFAAADPPVSGTRSRMADRGVPER
jgi:hypothetical protein